MMIQTHHAIAGGLMLLGLACPPTEPTLPDTPQAPKAPCTDEVILLPSLDAETTCDLIPPMILMTRLDDTPDGAEENRCHDAGGRFLHIWATDEFFCIDLDY
jgi:hypothetical protein